MRKKTIAVDFDGTLHGLDGYKYPQIGTANTVLIDQCKKWKEQGHCLILYTCRHDETLESAVKWCSEQGLEFDYVNENRQYLVEKYGDCRKVYADVYIDDRSVGMSIDAANRAICKKRKIKK